MHRLLVPMLLCAATAAAAATVPTDFVSETVATGLDQPVALEFLPDGRLLVCEQRTGNLRLVLTDGTLLPDPVLTVPDLILDNGEAGLLSLAVDPAWPDRPYVYCHYTAATPVEMRLTRYTASGTLDDGTSSALSFGSPVDLLTGIPHQAGNHNGGTLLFAPDGFLCFSLGDDERQCDVMTNDRFPGKILRLDVSGVGATGPVDRADLVASGNPFVGGGDIASLVWTKGLRNPFRMVVDTADGTLYVGDVGEVSREEISRVPTGGLNLGWPFREGFLVVDPRDGCTEPPSPDYTEPIWDYGRDQGVSVVAAFVYRAPSTATVPWPVEYEGDLFYVDFFEPYLRRLQASDGSWSIAPAVDGQPNPTDWATDLDTAGDFTIAPDGSVYSVSTFGGTVERIRYAGAVDAPPSPDERLRLRVGPNPFNPATEIVVSTAVSGLLSVRVFDGRGRHVDTVFEGRVPNGESRWTWRAEGFSSGVYHVRAETRDEAVTRKVALVE